jgi:site-specific DNA-methyltransferase (adenine-specific)
MKLNQLIHGDCMEIIKDIPDKYFELAIVDPPYGIGRNGLQMGNSIFNKDSKVWDNAVPTKEYFNELFRVSENQIIWGGNYFKLPCSQYFAIWDKGETMYGRDFAECEYAWVRAGGTRMCKNNPNQVDRIHPTQKPVKLYKWLLDKYAKQDDKILDTHAGSCSSVIACLEYGFEYLAIEKDIDYYNSAMKRINDYKSQMKLFP